jgi:hypothetical protein
MVSCTSDDPESAWPPAAGEILLAGDRIRKDCREQIPIHPLNLRRHLLPLENLSSARARDAFQRQRSQTSARSTA